MAGSGLLALLDDITSILDDVATMSKVAAQKTAGIAGDDLAVNAEGLVGLQPSRELPIVGKVALGSVANKIVLVPLALALPHDVIVPLLMFGGTFLCYEGVHKVLHRKGPEDEEHHDKLVKAVQTSREAVAQVEAKKVRRAILTDVVLSAEIVAVALSALMNEPFATRAITLSVVALGMTVFIYGLVAAIVKIDDVGMYLEQSGESGGLRARLGWALVNGAPWLMRLISLVGTVAMFLVGGGILVHGIPGAEEQVHDVVASVTHSGLVEWVLGTLANLGVGVVAGLLAVGVVEGVKRVVRLVRPGAVVPRSA